MNSMIPGADESEELTPGSSAEQPAALDTVEENSTPEPAEETRAELSNGAPKATSDDIPTEAVETSEPLNEEESAEAAEALVEEAVSAPTAAAEQPRAASDDTPAEAVETSEQLNEEESAEAAEAPVEEVVSAPTATAEQEPPLLKRGEVLDGTVIATSPTSVQVALGDKGEGIIPGRELERMNRETLELLKPGEVVPVYVVNPRDHQGNVVLSVNRALEERDWQEAEEYRVEQKVYESRVAGYNKGGLIVRFGRVRGFVPQSQISAERRAAMDGETPEERWGEMVNAAIAVKVMEVDRSRNRLILSERAAAREVRESRKENLITDLQVGETRTGRVVSLVDFGAFIDIGGAEGLVHLTELSWQHVTHPREILNVGDEVRVEVISVDPDRKRIGLSMKSQAADPWDTVAIEYNVGQLVQGTITKLTKFGAFAQLVNAPEIEGLIHISELSDQRVNHPREVVKEGDTLTLRVVKMDIQNRRLGLSLKRVNSPEYLDQDWDY
ncbi:MAG: S1 RNA-binding domain-containing protein [Anaerolineae bacterium]|nr:S1 RNA-binding domain-containing protein [Anaerolineae bacterium]